jgi:hypothetical protein
MLNDRYMDLLKDKYKVSYLLFKENKPTEAFSSHQPLLIHVLNTIKEGKVLEFGLGWNSTPLMNLICGMQGRQLISVETNEKWFRPFESYNKSIHPMLLIAGDELLKGTHKLFKQRYSVVFVDGAPAELRQPFIEKIKKNADYLIVHDTECVPQGLKNVYAYDFSSFKHVLHFKTQPPMTSLLSDLDEINPDLLEVFKGYE